ncbi:MAG: hypothetical protein KDN05_01820 [Verrucomicrobiae bacterium]|nr:hypothetical protein [Verrucomicrobiae bacterium]
MNANPTPLCTVLKILISGKHVLAGIVIVAGTAPHGLGDGLPLVNTVHDDFVGSANCASCHSGLQDHAGQDVSIDSHWRSTMMANSAKDPLWQAKVSSEVQRNPALQSVIEGKCATCHMPMAATQAKAQGTPVKILGTDGFLNEAHALHDLAMDGVSCAACHQISNTNLGQQASFSGGYTIDTSTNAPDRLIYGPFANPFANQMRNNVGFTPVEGAHMTKSQLCGTCHTLETPFVDAAGAVVGTFPEQMTYLEWEHSQFNSTAAEGRECQDCHMPAAYGGVVLSNRGGPGLNLQARSPYAKHHFVGGNEFMLKLMSANIDELKLTASTQQLEDTRVRLITQMESATARLSVAGVHAGNDTLELGLLVENLVGHKFPSGFPSRRTWLHFTVTDGNDEVFFESGRPDATGRIAGNDADFTEGGCEPHHRVVSSPGQVQIYESVMENTDGEVTYTLLRGAAYRKDNRLLPQGFDLASADPRIAVFGGAAGDPDFTGGQDKISYRVATGGRPGPYLVDVKLCYQSVSAAFATDLRQDSTNEILRYITMHDAADHTPVTVATLRISVDPADFYQLALDPAGMTNGPDLTITGPGGGNVDIEVSDDLSHWSLLESLQPVTLPYTYQDAGAIGVPKRFYRLNWPFNPTTPVAISLPNGNFDQSTQSNFPTGFDSPYDVPNWTDISIVDSGIEPTGVWWQPYSGYSAFMKAGDAAYLMSGHTIQDGDRYVIGFVGKSWDGSSEWTATLFYDDPENAMGSYVRPVNGSWTTYNNPDEIPATPGAIGRTLGIKFVNTGTGFANLDNVTLSVRNIGP